MKKIYLYDLNMPSLMAILSKKIEEKGVEIIHIEKLNWINENDNYPVVINPLSSLAVAHWEGIKQFIPSHSDRRIIMTTPDYSQEKLEEIVGVHSHLKIFGKRIDMGALLKELTE
jgi:hypothetical protein